MGFERQTNESYRRVVKDSGLARAAAQQNEGDDDDDDDDDMLLT
jgi:hypothetical protein